MGNSIAERTPLVIAAEINMIKHQTEQMVLNNFIEIGRRLKEAKDQLPHGEWGKWLKESVNFSVNRAEKLMRIYDAYGTSQTSFLNAGAQTQELPNLSYTQALILLGVPEEERTQFILDMDIESMSTRELQKAVDVQKQAQLEKDQVDLEKANLQQTLTDQTVQITRLTEERDSLKISAEQLAKTKVSLEQAVEKKRHENKTLKEESSYKAYQRLSGNLTAAQIKLATHKVAFHLEGLEKSFKELTYEINLLAQLDKDVYQEYKKRVSDFLMKALKERIES